MLRTEVIGQGRPVVVLPSFGLDGASMARVLEPAFAAASARTDEGPLGETSRVYVDLPGTGGSTTARVDPTSDAVLDAVVATVESVVGTSAFSVAGWSYGGYLALGLLRRLPDRVASALLVATGTRVRSEDRDLSGSLPSAEEPGWLDAVPAHLHDHLRQAVGRQDTAVAGRVTHLLAANAPTDDPFLERLRTDGFALTDERSLTRTGRPVVLLAGRRDRVSGYRSLLDALAGFDRGDVLLSATAGHYLPVEEPDLLVAGIEHWHRVTRDTARPG